MTFNIIEMNYEQFNAWLKPIVNSDFFLFRERLAILLAQNADREALESGFREFFEGYCGLAFSLEEHEEMLLAILDTHNTFSSLKERVNVVESARKTSSLGREARRMGMGQVLNDPEPDIKVSHLSDDAFCSLMDTLVNWSLFAVHTKVVKLQKVVPWAAKTEHLKSAFLEFFVCYLELEQFLEDYDYDPDDELELSPEIAEKVEQSVTAYESGEVKPIPIEEVAKKQGLKW